MGDILGLGDAKASELLRGMGPSRLARLMKHLGESGAGQLVQVRGFKGFRGLDLGLQGNWAWGF